MSDVEVEPYTHLAEIYDRAGWMEFSGMMLPYLEGILRRFHPPGRKILDVACGTGTLAISLAKRGYRVYGIDRSGPMLREAKKKARKEKLDIPFVRQDLREPNPFRGMDLVTCFFDSLNYILRIDELKAVFEHIHRALGAKGLFIFDMNTIYGLANGWGNKTANQHFEDGTVIGEYTFIERTRTATIELTAFIKVGKLYRRFTEVHRERGYTKKEVGEALKRAGFRTLALYGHPTYDKPRRNTGRIVYVAQK